MKKYLFLLGALCVLPMSAFAANGFVGYDNRVPSSEKLYKKETAKNVHVNKWYAGLNGDLSFLTWKNKYSGVDTGSENFTFKPVLGLDLSVGYRFDQKWHVDGELGYIGKYTEKETEHYLSPEKTEFSLETYYIDANAYYDLNYGLYAGAGLGLAIVKLSADNTYYSEVSKTNVSPMGALMFGWSYALDEKVDFDVRYRLAIFDGGDLSIGGVNVDTGIIMNNSLSVGLKYHF